MNLKLILKYERKKFKIPQKNPTLTQYQNEKDHEVSQYNRIEK